MSNQEWTLVIHENCGKVQGPFYHGWRASTKIVQFLKTEYSAWQQPSRLPVRDNSVNNRHAGWVDRIQPFCALGNEGGAVAAHG